VDKPGALKRRLCYIRAAGQSLLCQTSICYDISSGGDLYAGVADRTVEVVVAEQQLHGSVGPCSTVDQSHLGVAQEMRSIGVRIQADRARKLDHGRCAVVSMRAASAGRDSGIGNRLRFPPLIQIGICPKW